MPNKLSPRLKSIIDALSLNKGMRILEIGCGPGAMAREIASRISNGHVLAIDRSAKAIEQATLSSVREMDAGLLSFRQVAIENFELLPGEEPFDLAVAIRVGALDGRHPEMEAQAMRQIAKALTLKGRLFMDGGNPLKEVSLGGYR